MEKRNERGAVMLESTYCILISIIVLMFFMSFGFFLYQKTLVTVVANEVAQEISQTYKYRNVRDDSAISKADIEGVGMYRYLFFEDSFISSNENKAKNLANIRLSKTSLAKDEGNLTVEVDTVIDDIGRRHYEVTVKQRYSFLLGDLLSFIGQKDVQVLEKTAYVESSDVMNYFNIVKAVQYAVKKTGEPIKALEVINSAFSLIKTVFE